MIVSSSGPAPTGAGHRYYKLSFNAAQVDTSGKIALNEIVFAESAGGPQAVTAGMLTGPVFDSGNVGRFVDGDSTAANQIQANGGVFPRDVFIDFGSNPADWRDIHELRIAAGNSGFTDQEPKDFTFYRSPDNSTWTARITVTGSPTFGDAHASNIYQSATCPDTLPGFLFYRLNCTLGNQPSQFAVEEIELHISIGGSDVSAPGNGVLYSTQSTGNEAVNAFDNTGNGYFSLSGQPYPQYVGVELSQRQTVVEAVVFPYGGFQAYAPENFTIDGSNDKSSWTPVITATGQTGWAPYPTSRTFT